MAVAGGLRARLIHDSVVEAVRAILADLGWFDSGRRHLPLAFADAPANWNDPIDMNTICVLSDRVDDEPAEMGSLLTEDRWDFYIDFYGENDAVANHVMNDVRDALRGKLPSIGWGNPVVPVYDWQMATPAQIFSLQVEEVVKDRYRDFPHVWQRYWYTVRLTVSDTWNDEDD